MTTLESAHKVLIERLTAISVPRIVGEADGHDLRNLADHCIEVSNAVDSYMRSIGREAASNTVGFDEWLFDHPLYGALDGNGLGELHRHAEILDEEYQDVA